MIAVWVFTIVHSLPTRSLRHLITRASVYFPITQELSEELSEGDAREAGPWLRRYVLMMQANEDAIMPHNLILLANVLSSESELR